MTARLWHGRVPLSRKEAYRAFLNARAIPDYRGTPGNRAVFILEREEGGVAHFTTLTFWEDFEAIRRFAGEPVETAKYYPEDRDFLLEFEPAVAHWEVVGQAGPSVP